MKATTVAIIASLAILLGAAAWWLTTASSTSSAPPDNYLFAGLEEQINQVNRITLSNARGEKVTLNNTDDIWRIDQKARYYADTGKVRALLLAIAKARIIEQKTANPELYDRLGLRDISEPESAAVLLELENGENRHSVLVGNSSARAGGSTYVRKPGVAVSLMVSPAIEATMEPMAWVDNNILNINASHVQSIAILKPGAPKIEISKTSREDDAYVLQGSSADASSNTPALDAIAGNLAALKFDNVIRVAALAIKDYESFDITYTLFSGQIIDGKLFYPKNTDAEEKHYWFGASVRFDAAVAQAFVPQPSTDSVASDDDFASDTGSAAERLQLTDADLKDRSEEAAALNARLQGWLFEIPEARYKTFHYSSAP